MATTTLDNALDALVTGLATVTGLSSTTVAKYDYSVLRSATAAVIAPAFRGQQEQLTTVAWAQTHWVNILLSVRQTSDIKTMLTSMATLIPLVQAWLRANESLGKADVNCSMEPSTYEAGNEIVEDNGVVRKEVVLTVPVTIFGMT